MTNLFSMEIMFVGVALISLSSYLKHVISIYITYEVHLNTWSDSHWILSEKKRTNGILISFLNKHVIRYPLGFVLGSRMSWCSCSCNAWLTTVIHNRQIRSRWSNFHDILWRFSCWQRYCNEAGFVELYLFNQINSFMLFSRWWTMFRLSSWSSIWVSMGFLRRSRTTNKILSKWFYRNIFRPIKWRLKSVVDLFN